MRIIFMGKDKPVAVDALRHLIGLGQDVAVVVGPQSNEMPPERERLADVAKQHGIRIASDTDLYGQLRDGHPNSPTQTLGTIDIVVSVLFWKRLHPLLLDLPRLGCINFHPAPLPEFRGVGGHNVAILEDLTEWGASAHFMSESFDTGDLIAVRRFPIHAKQETAWSLEQKTNSAMLALFKKVIDMAIDGRPLPRSPQGPGRYITRAYTQELRRIRPHDSVLEIDRKVRAFWYPPYPGATIQLRGQTFTLITEDLLHQIRRLYIECGEKVSNTDE